MIRRIAVCDDEPEILKLISVYLSQIEKETKNKFEIFYYSSAENLIKTMPRDIQIVLLDIGMSPITGMEAAHQLRAENLDFTLIFISSMIEYALEGYDVHAFAFLDKPIRYPALCHQLEAAFRKIDKEQYCPPCLVIETIYGMESVDLSKLIYAEVYQHETSFVFSNERKTSMMSLSEVESQTKYHGFFRCHKSYLVNMRQISKISTNTITLTTGETIPVSKYRRKDFLGTYARFMGV